MFLTVYTFKFQLRALLHRVIAKQQAKREQTHPVCLHTAEKYKKVENVNKLNDNKTASKKMNR